MAQRLLHICSLLPRVCSAESHLLGSRFLGRSCSKVTSEEQPGFSSAEPGSITLPVLLKGCGMQAKYHVSMIAALLQPTNQASGKVTKEHPQHTYNTHNPLFGIGDGSPLGRHSPGARSSPLLQVFLVQLRVLNGAHSLASLSWPHNHDAGRMVLADLELLLPAGPACGAECGR